MREYEIKSVKDLAEKLRTNNVQLNDTTIVYCNTTLGENPVHEKALKFIKQETRHPILYVSDSQLAE
jgi:hypothetical protein